MGDSQRFRVFAEAIGRRFPDRGMHIADVASGNGGLQASLRQLGYDDVVSWDTRRKNAGPRRCYRYGLFDYRNAPRGYDLVIGMHPDEATDHIVSYAVKHRKPFLVCPCCVKPSASKFQDVGFDGWIRHLVRIAEDGGFDVSIGQLKIRGKSLILEGRPN